MKHLGLLFLLLSTVAFGQAVNGANLSHAGVAAAGTSLVRPLSTRFAEVANVKDFGAVGDGNTNDSSAFTAAVAALTSAKGGTLFIPAGVYKTNFSVATSNVAILGVSAGTDVSGSKGGSVLLPYDKANPVITLGSGTADVRMLEVARLSVWGDTTGATSDCIRIVGALDVSIHDVSLVNAGRDALRLESSATKATSFVDVSHARIMWARGAGVDAIYGTSGVTSVHVSDSMVEGWTTGYAVYLDGVQLYMSNTWVQVGATGYGVYLKNEGGTLAKLLGTRTVNIDSSSSSDVLVTFDASTTHNATPWSYVSPEVGVDGVAEWLADSATIAMGAFGYAPTAVWPYVTGRLAFQPNDLSTPTTPNPSWYLYGMDSGGAPALYLTGAALRGDFTYAHPIQGNSPQTALWFDTTAKYLRVRRDGRTASADSNGEVVPIWKGTAPSTLTDACYVGEMAYSTSNFYICTASNTWHTATYEYGDVNAADGGFTKNVAVGGTLDVAGMTTLVGGLATGTFTVDGGVQFNSTVGSLGKGTFNGGIAPAATADAFTFYKVGTHAALDLASVSSGACSGQTTETVAAVLGDSCRVSAGTAIEAGGFTTCAVTATNEEKWQFCNLSGAPIDRASDTYTIRVLR